MLGAACRVRVRSARVPGAPAQRDDYNVAVRPRFYVPGLDTVAGRGVLDHDEASHLTRVLRLGIGAEVVVFDGRGGMYLARVSEAARARVAVELVEQVAPAPEPRVAVTLALSILKGDKMDGVVRDAAMIGISAVHPVVSTRAEMAVAAVTRGHRVSRWQRIAVSSVKQCGGAVVPTIHAPAALEAWLARRREGPTLVLVEPAAGRGRTMSSIPPAPAATILVGPEGGWTPGELRAITAAGAEPVALGPRTLRGDAAPLVAMAALYEAWDGW